MYISAHAHHSDERGQSVCDARIAHSAHRAPTELPQMRTRLHRADTKAYLDPKLTSFDQNVQKTEKGADLEFLASAQEELVPVT